MEAHVGGVSEKYLGTDLGTSPSLDRKQPISARLGLRGASEQSVQTQVPATLVESETCPPSCKVGGTLGDYRATAITLGARPRARPRGRWPKPAA